MHRKIRTVGDFYYNSNIPRGLGARITHDFLSRITEEFAKESAKYIRVIEEVPFAYRERQLHSMLAPALSSFTDAFLMDSPIIRDWSKLSPKEYNDSYGWVDYWCYYRNMVFIIELKHGYISASTTTVRENVKNSWKLAKKQLDVVEKEADWHSIWSKGAFRLVLLIGTIYDNSGPGVKDKTDRLLGIRDKTSNELDPNPNWIALWKLHHQLLIPKENDEGKKLYYPGLLFLSNISKVHKVIN